VADSRSIAFRAGVSLALLIGFYFFAVAIAGLLLAAAYYLGVNSTEHFSAGAGKLILICVAGAGIILWSIVPRIDRFKPPGPLLTPEEQPALFQMIAELSQATNEAMPSSVYLIPHVNAYVAQRGGLMGFGSKRIMGLGLPLLRVLTVPELRAVLAHEFGHYYGGDTRLGPVVYHMRGTIHRTVMNLAKTNYSAVQILHKPFHWYGSGALRITQSVSRSQEYAADQLAVRTVGAAPMASGLRTIHAASAAYRPFLDQELAPTLLRGARPPLAEGFAFFLAKAHIASQVSKILEQEIAEPRNTAYDSHPPLRDRLAALQVPPESDAANSQENATQAISLLNHLDQLEIDLLIFMTGNADIQSFRTASWADIRSEVYLASWREMVSTHQKSFCGVRPRNFPRMLPDLVSFGRQFVPPSELPPPEVVKERGAGALAGALACALVRRGWTMLPETEASFVSFQSGESILDPFAAILSLLRGETTGEDWTQRCEIMGIADWDLSEN
jgi:heat shock protein HtpX